MSSTSILSKLQFKNIFKIEKSTELKNASIEKIIITPQIQNERARDKS